VGPDRARFGRGIESLLATTWHLSPRRDRVGARLEGGRIERVDHGASMSMPMVRGAIQVPPSGEPIVLGPDHPTTGGYPVVAVVIAEDAGAFYARPPGATIAFTLARV
jgi:allophanate hydrolase subunit 2